VSTTDRIPDIIADAASEVGSFVSDVGHVLEGVPDVVEGGVAAGVHRGRRMLAAVPFIPVSTRSNRRWWVIAGIVGVVGVVTAIWLTRRSSDDSTASYDAPGTVRAVA